MNYERASKWFQRMTENEKKEAIKQAQKGYAYSHYPKMLWFAYISVAALSISILVYVIKLKGM